MDNNDIITTYNGIEVYHSDIDILCSEYESQFNDLEERINKPMFFTGLISFINRRLFKNITDRTYNNDYNGLNTLFFDCFMPLSAKYNRTITLQNFCLLTGISTDTLTQILHGTYKDGSKVNENTFQTVKKWKDAAEAALIDNGMSGNPVFSIFALKAGHGWKETPQEITVTGSATQATPEQIAERYQNTEKPKLPELSDN